MDRDYVGGTASDVLGKPMDMVTLDALQSFGDRLENSIGRLVGFSDRYRGYGQEQARSSVAPVPSGHAGQLSRLNDLLNQLESLSSDIASLG